MTGQPLSTGIQQAFVPAHLPNDSSSNASSDGYSMTANQGSEHSNSPRPTRNPMEDSPSQTDPYRYNPVNASLYTGHMDRDTRPQRCADQQYQTRSGVSVSDHRRNLTEGRGCLFSSNRILADDLIGLPNHLAQLHGEVNGTRPAAANPARQYGTNPNACESISDHSLPAAPTSPECVRRRGAPVHNVTYPYTSSDPSGQSTGDSSHLYGNPDPRYNFYGDAANSSTADQSGSATGFNFHSQYPHAEPGQPTAPRFPTTDARRRFNSESGEETE